MGGVVDAQPDVQDREGDRDQVELPYRGRRESGRGCQPGHQCDQAGGHEAQRSQPGKQDGADRNQRHGRRSPGSGVGARDRLVLHGFRSRYPDPDSAAAQSGDVLDRPAQLVHRAPRGQRAVVIEPRIEQDEAAALSRGRVAAGQDLPPREIVALAMHLGLERGAHRRDDPEQHGIPDGPWSAGIHSFSVRRVVPWRVEEQFQEACRRRVRLERRQVVAEFGQIVAQPGQLPRFHVQQSVALEEFVTERRMHLEEQVRAPTQVVREPALSHLRRLGRGTVDHHQHLVPQLGKFRIVFEVRPAPGQVLGKHAARVAVQSQVTGRVPAERHGGGQDHEDDGKRVP